MANSSPVHVCAWFSAVRGPSEREPICIGDQGRLWIDGGGMVTGRVGLSWAHIWALFEVLLVTWSMQGESKCAYSWELIDEDSVFGGGENTWPRYVEVCCVMWLWAPRFAISFMPSVSCLSFINWYNSQSLWDKYLSKGNDNYDTAMMHLERYGQGS